MAGAERDANGEPTRLLLSLQAWGANSKEDARKKAKAISARNKVAKASFGGNRSEAGEYAANIRWQRYHAGEGTMTKPTTVGGEALGVDAPSLVTHCDLDALHKELKAKGLKLDSPESPELILKYLSPEKFAEITDFVANAVEGIPVNPNGPIVYVKGGGGAAGKSTSEGSLVKVPETKGNKSGISPKAVMSNADEYKVASKGFINLKNKALEEAEEEIKKNGVTDAEKQEDVRQDYFAKYKLAAFVHEESSIVGKIITSMAIKNGQDVVVDGTMDNGLKKRNLELDLMRELGAKEIHGLFYSCDTDTAVERSKPRARNPKSADYGRQVPEDALRAAHKGVSVNFPSYVTEGKFDSIILFDTNEKPNRIAAQYQGEQFEIIQPKLYDKFLAKAGE